MSLRVNQLIGFAAGGVTLVPSFVDAGAAAESQNAAGFSVSYPATVLSGQLLVLHVCLIDGVADSTMGTPTDFTLIDDEVFDSVIGHTYAFYKVADGTEGGGSVSTGAIGGTFTNLNRRAIARIYRFTDNTTSSPVEGTSTQVTISGTTVADAGVVTSGAKRLAVNLVARTNDGTMGSFTGETGGDWTEATAEAVTTLGSDAGIQLQTAAMDAAGTINGGTFTAGDTAEASVIGFAIKPI